MPNKLLTLDATPIPSDWTDIGLLFADMAKHARENPNDEFITADDAGIHHAKPRTPRLGWIAFRPGSSEDFSKQWTITLINAKETMRSLEKAGLDSSFRSATSRSASLEAFVENARR